MYIMSNNNLQISYTKMNKNIIIITIVLIQNQSETIPETIPETINIIIIIIIIQNQSKVKPIREHMKGGKLFCQFFSPFLVRGVRL